MIDIGLTETINTEGKLAFRLPGTGSVTGAVYAAQKFAKILLTSPGSDKFFPTLGGGLSKLINSLAPGQTYEDDIQAKIINSLSTTRDQIKKAQSTLNIGRKDAFVDYDIMSINVDLRTGSATCSVRVRTFEETEHFELGLNI
jgi:hypothetical protein